MEFELFKKIIIWPNGQSGNGDKGSSLLAVSGQVWHKAVWMGHPMRHGSKVNEKTWLGCRLHCKILYSVIMNILTVLKWQNNCCDVLFMLY